MLANRNPTRNNKPALPSLLLNFLLHIIRYSLLLFLIPSYYIVTTTWAWCQPQAAMSLESKEEIRKGKEPAKVTPPFGRRDFSARELIPGAHIIVEFLIKGYKYTRACIVVTEPDEDGDFAVYRLRCADDTQKLFYLENTRAVDIKYDQIFAILPPPQQYNLNHGTQFLYAEPLDIFEEGFD